jgi:hypothetical protein
MLFQTIEQFKEYTTVQKNMSFKTLTDSIGEAEERFLLPLIAPPQYLDLLRLVDPNNEELPTAFDEAVFIAQAKDLGLLLKKARKVVAKAAMYIVYPSLNVTEGDMGIQQNKAANDTSLPSQQWAYNGARSGYLEGISTASELLLSFLQDNKAKYPKWVNSRAYSEYNSLFIRNNSELGRYINTQDSIRAYMALRPYLQLSEEKYILPIVPKVTIEVLKAAIKTNNINAEQQTAIDQIRKVTAWYALFESLPFGNIRMEGMAISVPIIQDGTTKYGVPTDKDKAILLSAVKENALLFYTQLQEFYKPQKEAEAPQTISTFVNSNKPDFWV